MATQNFSGPPSILPSPPTKVFMNTPLAMKKLQHERDTWNEERLERIDYINEELKKRGHAAKTFQNVDQAMQQYYFLTGNVLPPLSAQPQLENFLDDEQNFAAR